jgi:hypothetical protein
MSRLTALVALALLVISLAIAPPASAAQAGKTVVQSVLITAQTVTPTNNQCLTEYANNCSSGTCTCMSITNPTVRGTLVGKGSAITGDVEITTDVDAATNFETPNEPGCNPVFADISLTNGSFILDNAVLLNLCSTGKAGTSTLNGGWSVETSTNNETGGGSATGMIKNGTITLRLVGAVTIPAAM